MSLAAHLNQLSADQLADALTQCCAARRWVAAMAVARPFADDQAVLDAAVDRSQSLARADWLEAFAAHPQIGDLESLRARFANTRAWAGREQAGVAAADEQTLTLLAQGNREYRARFGYIFIVCATGKSAEEMLAILQSRLPNAPEVELPIAAGEQLKITLLRLQKLLA